MRAFLLASVACCLISLPAAAAPAEARDPNLTGRDLFGLQSATDPQFRPDGGQIAYVRISNDIMTDKARRTIWLADPKTGAQTPLATEDGAPSRPGGPPTARSWPIWP